jgi:putative transposase
VFIERLWRSLKYECVYLNNFENITQAKSIIKDWIIHYNMNRPHSTFDGKTPHEIYVTELKGFILSDVKLAA